MSHLLVCCVSAWLALACVAASAQSPVEVTAVTPTVPDQVGAALRMGDFPELERLYAIYGQPGVRSPLTGTERVRHFWVGIAQVLDTGRHANEAYYVQMDAITRKWALERPESALAQLLYAQSLKTHGWFLRGGGYANTVSQAGWIGFNKYLNLALDHLRRDEELYAKDSSWNALLLGIGRDLGWRVDQLLPVFENGIAKNPDHDQLYFSMMDAMLPKWGGDLKTAERFIASVTQKTKETRGMEMYARLYAGLSYSETKQSLFSATDASWPTMKAGFEDRLSRYPHTDHRNMYAYFACMADDRQALREQLDLMGDAFERIFWGDKPVQAFEKCKALARQP